jgi:type IV secretion system protein VirD4
MAPSGTKGKSQFQMLMNKLPSEHKAKWFAGAALNAGDQAMASVLSTVLSCLNAFLDSELEQVLCFDTAIDAEKFCAEKSAIFLVLPEENPTTYFLISLIIQQLYREILTIADENGGKLKNRVVFFCDELGTLPPIQSLEIMLSASRSRRLSIMPIIQSFGQLQKNYGKEGSEIIVDNCQLTIFGGFAPNSETAEVLSKSLGTRTVLSGSVSRSKNDPSQSLQMMERPLMTADELKALKRGNFIVTKTGFYPMRTRLRLFLEWGITFSKPYTISEKAHRRVAYADKKELERAISQKHPSQKAEVADYEAEGDAPSAKAGGMAHTQSANHRSSRGNHPAGSSLKTEGGVR